MGNGSAPTPGAIETGGGGTVFQGWAPGGGPIHRCYLDPPGGQWGPADSRGYRYSLPVGAWWQRIAPRPGKIRTLKQILVLGAGQSAAYLIFHLLGLAHDHGWFVTVGDLDLDLARARVAEHAHGKAIYSDVKNETLRSGQIAAADVVINMLPAAHQGLVAWDCVNHGRHMLSVSYRDRAVRDLGPDAHRKGVLLLCELGLDPGIDHMSAMALIRRLHADGGRIRGFRSYGSGIPAHDQPQNPLRYVITWNPRNVVMAGYDGAQYMENGKIKLVPYHQVFHHTWTVDVDGVGTLEAYPNRDSMAYRESFGLHHAETMIRGTLRHQGWSETWSQIVRLGLPNETLRIPGLRERTYREVIEMFLPLNFAEARIEQRVAGYLGISPTGRIMENLRWLGIFSDQKVVAREDTAASMMAHVLQEKLPLTHEMRDLVILVHEMEVEYPEGGRAPEKITSTLVSKGEAGGFSAMSKTVGLPTAIAAKLLLEGRLPLTGSQIPTHPSIYEPVLADIESFGLAFAERRGAL